MNKKTQTNRVAEISLQARKPHTDPFNAVELDAIVTSPSGKTLRVPAFWAGGDAWRFRYSSAEEGVHRYRTVCSERGDRGLHRRRGEIVVKPYSGRNALYLRGPLRVSRNRRHLEHADGTPFFWLGDTWWMGLCHRLHWPDEFAALARDRVRKGYNVVQIVAGLYPDMPAFDPRGANEAGFPWQADYRSIRPEYFDVADRRIAGLVDRELIPCIVGAWGYHIPWLGVDRLRKHWRYLVARWGAYPVTWCIAGEANLPYYLTEGFPFDDREQVRLWTEVARYLRKVDPYRRLTSIHPTGLGRLCARGAIDDPSLIDYDMLQTGHGDRASLEPTVDAVRAAYAADPSMPTLNSEVCYEGLLDTCWQDVQRLMFWTCVLSGACGHTYGANGIWQMNREGEPYGKSPHGGTYGPTPWNQAMQLPGSAQLGRAKRFLEKLDWWRLRPVQGDVAYADAAEGDRSAMAPYEARSSSGTRVIYAPECRELRVRGLPKRRTAVPTMFDPVTGVTREATGYWIASGEALVPAPRHGHDWALVIRTEG